MRAKVTTHVLLGRKASAALQGNLQR